MPADSLLRLQLAARFEHEDMFVLECPASAGMDTTATAVMAALLAGFVDNAPRGVSRLMALRNRLVGPLGLRTSRLGCPASSLLSTHAPVRFAGRFPVLDQRRDEMARRVEVILGADDRHLVFRTCIGVRATDDGRWACTLGTRVQTRNPFGRIYMAAIRRVHHRYISPAMLRLAVEHAVCVLDPAAHAPGHDLRSQRVPASAPLSR